MKRIAYIIFALLGCILTGCDKEDIYIDSVINPIEIKSPDMKLNAVKKNKTHLKGSVNSDAQRIVLIPEFDNDLRNSTKPIYIQAWDVKNEYNLSEENDAYYIQWSIDRDDFIGDAIYQHVLPRTPIQEIEHIWDTGYGYGDIYNSENFWTDDIHSSDFDATTFNKPLEWSYGSMIMKDVDAKPSLIIDLDKNDSGKSRKIIIRITSSPRDFVFISIVQNS